jgi:hypothetical protein
MRNFHTNPFDGQLDVVATLRDRQIESAIEDLKRQDDVTKALRSMLRSGVDINSLSEASGLTVEQIRERTSRELHFGDDLAQLAGLR